MALFSRLFFAVLIAGLFSGAAMTALQQWRVVPLIVSAEAFEGEDGGHSHGAVAEHTHEAEVAEHTHEAGTPAHSHDDEEWMPADGLERNFYTVATGIFAALGFAFLLSAVSVLSGIEVTARNGVLWGAAGFAVFQLAPAFGLPPELPGMPAADVTARQIWWWGTAIATATAIYGVVRFRNAAAIAIGVVLVLLPHVIGAPQPDSHESGVPAPLAAAFAANTLFAGAAFWLLLGVAYGYAVERLGQRAPQAVTA
jgi:cobalt transporter subunit CbtA